MNNKLKELLINLSFSLGKTFKNIEKQFKDDQSYIELPLLDYKENEFGKLTINFPPRIENKLIYILKIKNNLDTLEEFLELFTKNFTATFKIDYIEVEEHLALDINFNIMWLKVEVKQYKNFYKVSKEKNILNINLDKRYELGRYKLSFITTTNFLDEYYKRIDLKREEIINEIKEITGLDNKLIEINSMDWFNRNLLISKERFETLFKKISKTVTRNSDFMGRINKNDFIFDNFAFITRDSKYYKKSAMNFLSDFKINEKIIPSEDLFFDKLNFSDSNFTIIYNINKRILKATVIREMLRLNKNTFETDDFSAKFKIFDGEEERYSEIKDYHTKNMYYRYFCIEENFNKLITAIDNNLNIVEYATYLPKKLKINENMRKLIIQIN